MEVDNGSLDYHFPWLDTGGELHFHDYSREFKGLSLTEEISTLVQVGSSLPGILVSTRPRYMRLTSKQKHQKHASHELLLTGHGVLHRQL